MDKIVPYIMIENDDGVDGIQFDYAKLLTFLLKMFKLDIIAVREGGVQIAITLDGEDLSWNIQHVTCGVKICDPRAVNPITGIPIGCEGVQSREYCFPFKVLLAKDTKVLYQTHFKSFLNGQKHCTKLVMGNTSSSKLVYGKISCPSGRVWDEAVHANVTKISAIVAQSLQTMLSRQILLRALIVCGKRTTSATITLLATNNTSTV